MSDDPDVEEANARFYRAFEALDLDAMERVWGRGAHVACVHPGWPLLSGWPSVRASWESIFANTAEIRFSLSDVRIVATGGAAWVTCVENILSEVQGRLTVTSVVATNVFERDLDGWRMVHHHASHVLAPPAAG